MAEASRGGAERKDKRATSRRRSRLRVRFWNEQFEASAFTTDVSDSGLLIESARRLEPGTRLHVELSLGENSYFSEAVVTRRQDYPQYAQSFFKPALGLRFLGLHEALDGGAEAPAFTAAAPAAAAPEPALDAAAALAAPLPAPAPRGPAAPVPPAWGGSGKPSHAVDLREPTRLRALFARDLSKGALLVRTAERCHQLGTVLCVALRLPAPHADLHVQGEVVSLLSGSTQVGLLLEHRTELAEYLQELLDTLE